MPESCRGLGSRRRCTRLWFGDGGCAWNTGGFHRRPILRGQVGASRRTQLRSVTGISRPPVLRRGGTMRGKEPANVNKVGLSRAQDHVCAKVQRRDDAAKQRMEGGGNRLPAMLQSITNISVPRGRRLSGDGTGFGRSFEQGRCVTCINRADSASGKAGGPNRAGRPPVYVASGAVVAMALRPGAAPGVPEAGR